MANYVVWTKLKIDEFIYMVPMNAEQRKVFDDMVSPMKPSIVQTAQTLNVSDRTVNAIRDWLWKRYDEVQPYSAILTPRQMPQKRKPKTDKALP